MCLASASFLTQVIGSMTNGRGLRFDDMPSIAATSNFVVWMVRSPRLSCSLFGIFNLDKEPRHTLEHDLAALVRVPVWKVYRVGICPQLEVAKDCARCFGHTFSRSPDIVVQAVKRCLNQNRIMNRSANFNTSLRHQAARDPQHFSAITLHREVAQASRVWIIP